MSEPLIPYDMGPEPPGGFRNVFPRWTPEQVRLILLYGTCPVCGSPLDARSVQESPWVARWELICTASESADLATCAG